MQHQEYEQYCDFGGAIPDVYFQCDEQGSHETTPEEEYYHNIARGGYNAGSQEDYGLYGNAGYQDYSYQEYDHLNQGTLEGSLHVNSLSQNGGAYHSYGGGYAFTPYHAIQAPMYGGWVALEQGHHEVYALLGMRNEENRHEAQGHDKQPAT
jgi:hypothetical protein